jgi:hypothetical protein
MFFMMDFWCSVTNFDHHGLTGFLVSPAGYSSYKWRCDVTYTHSYWGAQQRRAVWWYHRGATIAMDYKIFIATVRPVATETFCSSSGMLWNKEDLVLRDFW